MESAPPLNTGLMENRETLSSRGESLVIDDRAICDELIAPLEAAMMRSIWQVVRAADLAEDCLQRTHWLVVWEKRFLIRLHPNPQAVASGCWSDCAASSVLLSAL